MFEYVKHEDYTQDLDNRVGLCFGISYSELSSGDGLTEHRFELHFDDQLDSRYRNIPNQLKTALDPYSDVPDFGSYYLYARQGFSLVQNWCANAVLRSTLFNLDANIISMIKPMRTNEFVRDDFLEAEQGVLPIFMIVVFLLPIYRLISLLTAERSAKTKDMARSMGIRESEYWLSWFMYYFIGMTFVTLIQALMLTYGVFQYSSFLPIFLIVWLYGMSLFGYIAFI